MKHFVLGERWVCSMGRDKVRLSKTTSFHLQITYLASNCSFYFYFRTLFSKSTGKKRDILQLQQRVKYL